MGSFRLGEHAEYVIISPGPHARPLLCWLGFENNTFNACIRTLYSVLSTRVLRKYGMVFRVPYLRASFLWNRRHARQAMIVLWLARLVLRTPYS